MSTVFLQVTIKALAEEAKIIRKEERKSFGTLRDSLHNHRVVEVRQEARATLLVYGYLRGRSVERVEGRVPTLPFYIKQKVDRMVKKYGNKSQIDGYEAWLKGNAPEPVTVPEVSISQAAGLTPARGAGLLSRLFG